MQTRERPAYTDRIVQDPDILGGSPAIKGTRIPVAVVIEYLARDPNFNDLFADYPRLKYDDFKACLAFAQALVEAVPPPHGRAGPVAQ